MITILNYGLGNVGSIKNILKKVGTNSNISSDTEILKNSTALIIPGVGSFDTGITLLEEKGLIGILNKLVLEEKIPVLGICLGMQLMSLESEEGEKKGLGWIDASTSKLPGLSGKVPNMGWRYVNVHQENIFFGGLQKEDRFYFVHSYYVECTNNEEILTSTQTELGFNFVSSFKKENIIGVQFHPEKSHQFGMSFFRGWLDTYQL